MPPRGQTDRRLLVVEDDPFIMDLLVMRLELVGYAVGKARNGRQALSQLGEFRPDAMLLDLNMPELDGFGVLRSMKARGLLASVPTMVLSARNAVADVGAAIELGARDYLSKPFRDEQLVSRVGRLLRAPRSLAS